MSVYFLIFLDKINDREKRKEIVTVQATRPVLRDIIINPSYLIDKYLNIKSKLTNGFERKTVSEIFT